MKECFYKKVHNECFVVVQIPMEIVNYDFTMNSYKIFKKIQDDVHKKINSEVCRDVLVQISNQLKKKFDK